MTDSEQEVLLVWSALLCVVGNPIIYMSCVTEYRDGNLQVVVMVKSWVNKQAGSWLAAQE